MIIIDRIEDGIAVLEYDTQTAEIPADTLPPGAAEGDILLETEEGYVIDSIATEERRTYLLRRTQELMHE